METLLKYDPIKDYSLYNYISDFIDKNIFRNVKNPRPWFMRKKLKQTLLEDISSPPSRTTGCGPSIPKLLEPSSFSPPFTSLDHLRYYMYLTLAEN